MDAGGIVTFAGDAVAAVDRATTERALAANRVEFESLPDAICPSAAMREDAPVLFPRGKSWAARPFRKRAMA
jgi:CO/xanthine dehydrogenase Mo-binding subunit